MGAGSSIPSRNNPSFSQHFKRELPSTTSGPQPIDSHPAKLPSKAKLEPLGPGLKRVDSLPANLPSNPPRGTDVEPVRKPITRPKPDAKPPKHFQKDGDVLEGSYKKAYRLGWDVTDHYNYFETLIKNDAEYMAILKSKHPDFENYSRKKKDVALDVLLDHPRFQADFAHARNIEHSIPTGPTATRTMKPEEQKFLTNAFRELNRSIAEKPFRMHGETMIIGNRNGELTGMNFSPIGSASGEFTRFDKFNLHNHRPFAGPFSSSASFQDHKVAAELYSEDNWKINSYLTNGKDALHIRPDSTELVKLIPDPNLEKTLGKFPEAFRLPNPQPPPKTLSHHEAPDAFKEWTPPKKAKPAARKTGSSSLPRFSNI